MIGLQRDFFVRLAQRRLLEGLARIDDTTRQRNLAAMSHRVARTVRMMCAGSRSG